MKKILTYTFAVLLAIACGGPKEVQPDVTEGEIVPPAYLRYDASASSAEALAVIWNSEDAYRNGAASYTVQLVKNQDEEIADGEISKTVMSYAPRRNDACVFFDLAQFERYYVRIRADFSKGSSDWVYIVDDSGLPTVVEVGRGPVEGGIAPTVEPEIRLLRASAGTITVEWSVTGFEELAQDVRRGYHIALYKDEAGTDLDVAWGLDRSFFEGNYLAGSADISFPAFVFTGLESGKDYWVEVKDSVSTLKSPLFKASTAQSQVVQVGTAPAKAGDVLLYEDFDELLWGGQAWPVANGYNTMQRINVSSFAEARASGEVEIDAENGFYPVTSGTSMVLFSTIQKLVPSTRLADWGQVCENGNKLQIGAKAGQILLGSNNLVGEIVTPPITNMSEVGTVELSFDAMPSYIRDRQDFKIEVISNSTFSTANNVVTVADGGSYITSAFDIEPGYEYKRYTVEIENFPAGARIGLGGNRPAGYSGQMRFILDNICVKLLKYGETEVVLAKPVITSAMPAVGGALVSWNAVPKAATYAIQFRKTGAADWTDFPHLIADTKATVTPFEKDVEYEVRIQAQVGKSKSEWSESVKVKSAPFLQRLVFINDTQVGLTWSVSEYKDLTADLAEGYTFGIYKDEACSQKMWEWTTAANAATFGVSNPGHVFSGLTPSTDYWIKVSISSGAESVYKYTTLPAEPNFVMSTAAKAGDVVLSQNFNELMWGGGDPLRKLSGVTLANYSAAFGTPDKSSNNKMTTAVTNDLNMFLHSHSGLQAGASAYYATTSLVGWKGYMSKLSNPTTLCGIVRFGGSSTSGFLVTPSIEGIKGTSNKVKVSFTAATATANHKIYVAAFPASVTVESNPFYIKTSEVEPLSVSEGITLSNTEWKEYSIELSLPAGGRIGIGTPVGTLQQVWLNDMKVELVETDYVAPDPDPVVQQKVYVNDSQIALRWSVSNFEDLTADLAEGYTFGIYKDESCSQKMWEWTTAAKAANFGGKQPGHVFSGLQPSTDYWVKVVRSSDGKGTAVKYTTAAADPDFLKTAKASAGDLILHEDFNDLLWGAGDPVMYLTGVDINNWNDAFGTPDASGNNKLSANLTQDRGILTNAHQGATTTGYAWLHEKPLFGWASYYWKSAARSNSFFTTVGGAVRFGGSSSTGYMVTPALTCLEDNAKLKVKVLAGAKKDAAQECWIAVFPADAALAGDGAYVTSAPSSETKAQTLPKDEWKSFEVEVDVPAGGRIGIGTKANGTAFEIYLSDVKIEVVSFGGSTPPEPEVKIKQKVEFIHNTQIAVRWSSTDFATPATDIASAWTFGIYKDAACENPVYDAISVGASSGKFPSGYCPGYVFSALAPGTDYWVKISSGDDSSVEKYTTANKDLNGVMTVQAAAGDVILAQDFDEMLWGCGDFPRKLVGFNHLASYTGGPFTVQTATSGLTNTGVLNLLNGVWSAAEGTNGAKWLASSSLASWRGQGSAQPSGCGYIRVQNNGYIVSPELNCLKQKARVRVTYEAAGNYNGNATVTLGVFAKDAATVDGKPYFLADGPVSTVSTGEIKLNVWGSFTEELVVEPGQRIGFGRSKASDAYYLSSIKVELVAYE